MFDLRKHNSILTKPHGSRLKTISITSHRLVAIHFNLLAVTKTWQWKRKKLHYNMEDNQALVLIQTLSHNRYSLLVFLQRSSKNEYFIHRKNAKKTLIESYEFGTQEWLTQMLLARKCLHGHWNKSGHVSRSFL